MVDAPVQHESDDGDHRDAHPAAPTDSRQDVRRLWRATITRAALIPLVVLAPLVTLALSADHRYNVYWHGADFLDHPLRLVTENIRTIPLYLEAGNFRPLGRMLEGAVDLAAFLLMELLNVPANLGLRLVSFLAAAVLTVVAVLFAESITARGRLLRHAPTRVATLAPFAIGAGFVAAGSTSTVVIFGGLYWLSTALVLTVAALVCRAFTPGPVGIRRATIAVLAGAALAAFNEIAYLALPLAVVAVALRGRVVLGLGWRTVLTGPAARITGLLWLGFLPVFIPVRIIIYGYCQDGSCYRGSDLAFGPAVLTALPNRLLSWLPPLQWGRATASSSWPAGLLPVVAFAVLALLAWRAAAALPRLPGVDRRQALGLAGAAAGLLVLGATLAALNGDMQAAAQAGRWGAGWRDSSLTVVGGSLTVLALCFAALAVRRGGTDVAPASRRATAPGGHPDRRWPLVGLLAGLTLTATASTAANRSYYDVISSRRAAILNNRIAAEVADFDTSVAGDQRRCALRGEFAELYQAASQGDDAADLPGSRTALGRFDATLNMATERLAGRPFCRAVQP